MCWGSGSGEGDRGGVHFLRIIYKGNEGGGAIFALYKSAPATFWKTRNQVRYYKLFTNHFDLCFSSQRNVVLVNTHPRLSLTELNVCAVRGPLYYI